MKLSSLFLLAATAGFGANQTLAQANEGAIRTASSNTAIWFTPGQLYFYTITVQGWGDLISFPGQPTRTALELKPSAIEVVYHSGGNISLRFCKTGNAALNNQFVRLWHGGALVDEDRLRCL
jgi:hypothetical protein